MLLQHPSTSLFPHTSLSHGPTGFDKKAGAGNSVVTNNTRPRSQKAGDRRKKKRSLPPGASSSRPKTFHTFRSKNPKAKKFKETDVKPYVARLKKVRKAGTLKRAPEACESASDVAAAL